MPDIARIYWNLIFGLYVKLLERKVKKGVKPKHIMLVADSISESILNFVKWCETFGVKEITICINNCKEFNFENLKFNFNIKINIVTISGRKEILCAVKELAKMVERGDINPEDVDEKTLENFLEVKTPPDLIVRAGEIIPDFLIWQSIYSEMYFADINWKKFRYVDFLRCLRDYQRRERRYGR